MTNAASLTDDSRSAEQAPDEALQEAHEGQGRQEQGSPEKLPRTLADLLQGSEDQDGADDASEASEGAEKDAQERRAPRAFNDLAEAAGLDLEALYGLQVQLDNVEEPLTIQQLKDAYRPHHELELERAEFEERRVAAEKETLRAQAELQEVLQGLPAGAINKQLLEKIRRRSEERIAQEQRRTLEAIPEWENEDARERELAGMAEHLAEYGFPTSYLGNVVNHRQMKYIRDNWKREQRVRRALEQVKAGKPSKTANGKTTDSRPKRATEPSRKPTGNRLKDFLTLG